MVLLIIIPIKWLFHWEYTLFSDKPICRNRRNFRTQPVNLRNVNHLEPQQSKLAVVIWFPNSEGGFGFCQVSWHTTTPENL